MSILITTTNSFENKTITKYYIPRNANVIVGTNVLGNFTCLSEISDNLEQNFESSASLHLLRDKKSFYDSNDVMILNQIIKIFDSHFPIKHTEREEISKGLFAKELIKTGILR